MGIITTIKNIFMPEREKLWLLFSFGNPSVLLMFFETTGDEHGVVGNKDHYGLVMDMPDDFIGFLHTHPSSATLNASNYDLATVRAWEKALDRPLFNIITRTDGSEINALYGGKPYRHPISIDFKRHRIDVE